MQIKDKYVVFIQSENKSLICDFFKTKICWLKCNLISNKFSAISIVLSNFSLGRDCCKIWLFTFVESSNAFSLNASSLFEAQDLHSHLKKEIFVHWVKKHTYVHTRNHNLPLKSSFFHLLWFCHLASNPGNNLSTLLPP